MIELRFSKSGLRYSQLWFNTSESVQPEFKEGIDILELRESYKNVDAALLPFRHGRLDLTLPFDIITDRFDKDFKYEVRRAQKESIRSEIKVADREVIANIFPILHDFCLNKGISVIPQETLRLYASNKALLISVAFLEDTPLQYHLYFSDDTEMMLLASFPSRAEVKRTLTGFANRALHHYDIESAYDRKLKFYNLGGMGNIPGANASIVKFKTEMAPEIVEYYNGLLGVTVQGKMFLKLKAFLQM